MSVIRPRIDALVELLKEENKVDFFEINYQPHLLKMGFNLGIIRDLMYWKLNRNWFRYCEIKNNFIFFSFTRVVLSSIKKLFLNKDAQKRWLDKGSIEMFLTNKHVLAIFNAQKNNADYLLVFEDDAVFKDDSLFRVGELLREGLKSNLDKPLYIDLAGGSNISNLKLDKLELYHDNNFRHYKRSVTNTTCCYLINKK